MTWRKELRRVAFPVTLPDGTRQLRDFIGASFRGVPFFVENAESSGGRRVVVHEFPLRDDPFVEDLGQRARTFRVDGYVIGDDYLAQRDALLSALESIEGPGELRHPFRGTLRAICVNVSVRESPREGGMATFAIEFAETPTQTPAPTEVVDAAAQVSTSADAAIEATKTEFVEQFDPDGLPSFALESAELALTAAAEDLGAKLSPVISATQELAVMAGQVEIITAQTSSLVRDPADVVDEFRSVIAGLVETIAAAPGAVMDALVAAYEVEMGPVVVATTATRARELANQLAITAALRRVIAIEAARLAPLVPYESIEAARLARDQVAELLEEQAGTAGDTTYPALVDLRSEVLRAVPGNNEFARVLTVIRSTPVPSLLLAYQLYGTVDRELDIIARNKIRNPGFVAGELQVLSNE
jgi:prophage DNA circulation protein